MNGMVWFFKGRRDLSRREKRLGCDCLVVVYLDVCRIFERVFEGREIEAEISRPEP